MKILHIAEFGKRATGIGTVVERLYYEQVKLGHEIKIITISANLAYKHLDLYTCSRRVEFTKYLKIWKPDAVLFHSIWAMPYIAFSKVLKKQSIPYAIMMHGADSKANRQSAPIKKWLANFIWFNRFMKNASTIIYLSEAEKCNCLSSKNNSKSIIIPNGCDVGEFDTNSIYIKKPLNIVFLGRLAKFHKGIDVLLDALEILYKQGIKDIKVNFYANENDTDLQYLKDRLPKLDSIATYLGGVYGDDKCRVLKNADAFILTSRFEGMPMGVLEALSFGVPCILTPGTNMADDIVKEGAGWKADFTPDSIAKTIIRAANDLSEDYNKFHIAAFKFSSKFNWEEIANQHIKLMKEISIINSCKKN